MPPGKHPTISFWTIFISCETSAPSASSAASARACPENAHQIVASRDRFLPAGEIVRLGGKLNQIGMEQLRLNHTELAIYTHKCGAALSEQQLENLFRSSEGWFSAIYLNLRALARAGEPAGRKLRHFRDVHRRHDRAPPPERQEFLAVMGLADELTEEMARFVTENEETSRILQDLTGQNAFVTRPAGLKKQPLPSHDERVRHPEIPHAAGASQTAYWNRFGDWYGAHGQYLHALDAYRMSANNDAALAIIEKDAGNLLSGHCAGGSAPAAGRVPGGGSVAPPDGASGSDAKALYVAGRFRRCCK